MPLHSPSPRPSRPQTSLPEKEREPREKGIISKVFDRVRKVFPTHEEFEEVVRGEISLEGLREALERPLLLKDSNIFTSCWGSWTENKPERARDSYAPGEVPYFEVPDIKKIFGPQRGWWIPEALSRTGKPSIVFWGERGRVPIGRASRAALGPAVSELAGRVMVARILEVIKGSIEESIEEIRREKEGIWDERIAELEKRKTQIEERLSVLREDIARAQEELQEREQILHQVLEGVETEERKIKGIREIIASLEFPSGGEGLGELVKTLEEEAKVRGLPFGKARRARQAWERIEDRVREYEEKFKDQARNVLDEQFFTFLKENGVIAEDVDNSVLRDQLVDSLLSAIGESLPQEAQYVFEDKTRNLERKLEDLLGYFVQGEEVEKAKKEIIRRLRSLFVWELFFAKGRENEELVAKTRNQFLESFERATISHFVHLRELQEEIVSRKNDLERKKEEAQRAEAEVEEITQKTKELKTQKEDDLSEESVVLDLVEKIEQEAGRPILTDIEKEQVKRGGFTPHSVLERIVEKTLMDFTAPGETRRDERTLRQHISSLVSRWENIISETQVGRVRTTVGANNISDLLDKLRENILKTYFETDTEARDSLYNFFKALWPEMTENTFWRVIRYLVRFREGAPVDDFKAIWALYSIAKGEESTRAQVIKHSGWVKEGQYKGSYQLYLPPYGDVLIPPAVIGEPEAKA